MERNYVLYFDGKDWILDHPLIILEGLNDNRNIIYKYGNETRAIIEVAEIFYKVYINKNYVDILLMPNMNIHITGRLVEHLNFQLKSLKFDPKNILLNVFLQLKNLVSLVLDNNREFTEDMISALKYPTKNPYNS